MTTCAEVESDVCVSVPHTTCAANLSMPAPPSRSSSARMCLKNSAARRRRRFASLRLSQRPCTMPLTKLGNVQRRGGEEIWKKLGRNSKRKYLKISGKNFLRCGGEIFLERKQKVPGEETAGSVSHTHSTIYLFNYLFEINFA